MLCACVYAAPGLSKYGIPFLPTHQLEMALRALREHMQPVQRCQWKIVCGGTELLRVRIQLSLDAFLVAKPQKQRLMLSSV